MITLYGMPRSRSLRVSWLLEELGLEWRYHYVDFSAGDQNAPAFRAISPWGKVPALQDDDVVLTESAAICQYLAEKYGNGQWLPPIGTPEAASYHRWYSFIICELEQPLWNMGKHKFALPKAHRVPDMQATAQWEFEQAITIAAHWLPDTPFLTGDAPTVVDILMAHTLGWARGWSLPIPDKLDAFRKQMKQRPAYAAALAKEQPS